tara:strand:- start:1361 stop:1777 length:417 start_codon:yes stop_codon:yes gene_type:complete
MSKKKKKFKETKLGQFLLGKSGLFQNLADTIPDKGILGALKNLIISDEGLSQQDKDVALEMLKIELAEFESITRRWEADAMSDSWLSKNVRPLTLVFMVLVYTVGFFLEYQLESINQIVLLIIGAYFGGRSFEKTRKL